MSANRRGGKVNPPQNENASLPHKMVLDYDKVPFANLAKAINKQVQSQECAKAEGDNITNRGLKEQEKANRLTKTGIIINGILTLISFIVLFFTIRSVKAADVAAAAAIFADTIALNSQTEVQREFDLQNAPLLQVIVDSVKTIQFWVGKKTIIQYYVGDLRDIPAKVISMKSKIYFSNARPDFEIIKDDLRKIIDENPPNSNQLITKETPIKDVGTATDTLSNEISMLLAKPGAHLYQAIAIKYQNLLTNTYRYSFIVLEVTMYRDKPGYSQIIENDIE